MPREQNEEQSPESPEQDYDNKRTEAIKQLDGLPEGSEIDLGGEILIKPKPPTPHEHYFIGDGESGDIRYFKCKFCPQGQTQTKNHYVEDGKIRSS